MPVKIHYCPVGDTLNISVRDTEVYNTEPLSGSDHDVNVDYDAEGRVNGITIQNASEYVAAPQCVEIEVRELTNVSKTWRAGTRRA